MIGLNTIKQGRRAYYMSIAAMRLRSRFDSDLIRRFPDIDTRSTPVDFVFVFRI